MKGIVFICGIDSTINERRCDTLGIPSAARLFDLVPATSQEQAERFFMTVRTNKAAFNWKFDLNTKEGKRLCYFAGVFDGNEITVDIVGSKTSIIEFHGNDEMAQTNKTDGQRYVFKRKRRA